MDEPGARYPDGEPGVIALGARHFAMRLYSTDSVVSGLMWWHDCPIDPGWSWLGIWGDRDSNHRITSIDPLTVTPSVQCPEGCGDHGYVRDGRWTPV